MDAYNYQWGYESIFEEDVMSAASAQLAAWQERLEINAQVRYEEDALSTAAPQLAAWKERLEMNVVISQEITTVDFDEIEEEAAPIYEEVKTIKDHTQIDGVMKDKVGERQDLKEIARSFWKKRSEDDADYGTESVAMTARMQKRGAIRRWEMDTEDGRTKERLEARRWRRGRKDEGGELRLRAAMGDRELGRRKMEERLEAGKEEEVGGEGGGGRRRQAIRRREAGCGRSSDGRLAGAELGR
ncbi:hypothetical protein ACLOJK_038427 [Asimina triloba]